MSIQRLPFENYVLLLNLVHNLKHTPFKPKSFLKLIRPFCKTEQTNFHYLHIRVRGSKLGVTIQIKKDCFIVYQDRLIHEYIFYCNPFETSSKSLLEKLLKHNLLTA